MKGSPVANPVTEQIDQLEVKACAAPADLMRAPEAEPEVPTPRDPLKGLQTDELYLYAQSLAEWGTRGWHAFTDWQDRERTLGSCVRKP